jgi:hypothetical protein
VRRASMSVRGIPGTWGNIRAMDMMYVKITPGMLGTTHVSEITTPAILTSARSAKTLVMGLLPAFITPARSANIHVTKVAVLKTLDLSVNTPATDLTLARAIRELPSAETPVTDSILVT